MSMETGMNSPMRENSGQKPKSTIDEMRAAAKGLISFQDERARHEQEIREQTAEHEIITTLDQPQPDKEPEKYDVEPILNQIREEDRLANSLNLPISEQSAKKQAPDTVPIDTDEMMKAA